MEFYTLVGDLPQDAEVTRQITQAILRTKFSQLIDHSNLTLSIHSLLIASLQVSHIEEEEAHLHIKNELFELCKILNHEIEMKPDLSISDAVKEENEDLFSVLIETALNLSVCASHGNTVKEFADIMSEMIDLCPKTTFNVSRAIWRLYRDLPVGQSQELLSLLLKLRTR